MAILKNRATQRKIHLRTLHVFGRGRSSDTLLENPDASQLHASIRWTGSTWELHDHSRNGTLLDGELLSHSGAFALRVGSTIGFGRDDGSGWVVEDLAAPANLLWPLGHDSAPVPLERSNLAWCFLAAQEVTSTMEAMVGAAPCIRPRTSLHFNVSLDEEHVRLQVQEGERQFDLGERTHHYALLTLARLRWADAQRHRDSQAHGWVELERLAKMLGVEPGHLNIQIFRMRKQLALAMP